MSDDTRRPGEDDENPTDPPTGEGEVVGADWLLSQLGSDQTGEIELPPKAESADAGAEGVAPEKADNPVLAWWREKLVAADELVNPEPRDGDSDEPALPEPGWTERTPAAGGPTLNEPEPEPESVPVSGSEREPASTPAPEPRRFADLDDEDDDDDGWSLGAESDLVDEPETGLIPSTEPPLFKPRSARDHIVEDVDQPVTVEPAEPIASDEPVEPAEPFTAFEPVEPFQPLEPAEPAQPDDADEEVDPDAAPPAIVVPAATLPTAAPVPPPELLEPAAATPTDGDDDEGDLEQFSWSLTPNDEPDPLVHRGQTREEPTAAPRDDSPNERPASGDQATAVIPAVGAASAVSAASEPQATEELPPRRRTRRQAEQPPAAEPVVIAEPGPPAPVKPARARPASGGGRPPRAVLLGAVALVAVLVIAGLFFLGSRLPALLAGPAPTPTASKTPTPSATPTPTPTVAPVGPAAAGEQKWTALAGGECLDPYSTPWAETFTVVDCAAPHAAQMVFSAPVNADPAAAFPGEDAILKQIYLWCSAPGVLDGAAAGAYSDLQVQGTYPVTEEQWADGERSYFCFVNRSSGEPLTGSVAVPQG